jgi:hypothetical protein
MGYIIDLTIVLEVLFWLKFAQPRVHQSICEDDVMAAFGLYQGSPEHLEVHQQIRSYVEGMTLADRVNPQDHTHVEIERLIGSHRRVLIDTIVSDAKHGSAPAQDASATDALAPDAPEPDAPEPDAPAQVAPSQPSSNAAQAESSSHPKGPVMQASSVSFAITTRRLEEPNDIYRRTLTVATIRHLKSSLKSGTFSGSSRKSGNKTLANSSQRRYISK